MNNEKKSNNNSGPKKEYAPSIAFWQSKTNEESFTLFVDEKVLDNLNNIQLGGRLLLSKIPEKYREGNDRAPNYRMSIFSRDDVESFGGKGTKPTPKDSDDAGL